MTSLSAIAAFGILWGMACGRIGYLLGKSRRPFPTPEQRAIAAKAGNNMRADRMHHRLDAWEFAKRTDSEPHT